MRQGLSFTRFFPEAMPTIPARRSLLSGRRVFPFHGWHPYRGLLAEPGWAPLRDPSLAFTSVLHARRLLDRVRDRQHGGRLLAALEALPPQRGQLRPARAASTAGARRACPRPSCGTGCRRRWRTPRPATGCAATWPTGATRTTRRSRSPRGSSATAPGRSRPPSAASPLRWSWTPSSRTSRGPRRASTWTCTATRTTAGPSRRGPTTPRRRATSARVRPGCCCRACRRCTRRRSR